MTVLMIIGVVILGMFAYAVSGHWNGVSMTPLTVIR